MESLIFKRIEENIKIHDLLLKDLILQNIISDLSNCIVKALQSNHKIVVCGNGGSASDAMHFVGEIVGRFQKDRDAWPAISLNSNVTTMTAIANDYGYNDIFSRQAEAIVNEGDVFVGISTSGNSENVVSAVCKAKTKGAITAALLGNDGGKIRGLVDYPIVISSSVTARIQECHILIIHIICELIEESLS